MRGRVEVDQLGKRFARRSPDRAETLQQWLLRGWHTARPVGHFWALRNVSFTVEPGEMLGIIGRNGSGKSTLLRLLGGVMKPDEGSVSTTGKVSGLLELNTGMHPDLSGRENIIVNGVVAGLSRRTLAERMDEIIAFAELERSIDNPVRTYSSGMKLRLGFAVAAHVKPEILLIDEILSVGDLAFQRKCLDRIANIKRDGASIILITHDLSQVEHLCDRAIWLNEGVIADEGAPAEVVSEYRTRETHRRTDTDHAVRATSGGTLLRPNQNRYGTFEAEIADVRLLSGDEGSSDVLVRGAGLTVEIDVETSRISDAPQVSVTIEDGQFQKLVDLNSEKDGIDLPPLTSLQQVRLDIKALDLPSGDYFVSVGLFQPDWEYAYDFHWRAYPLRITSSESDRIDRTNRWSIETRAHPAR